MAEDDIARTGIRVGGWLPTPDDAADAPERPVGPRRLPGDTDPATPRPVPPPGGDRSPSDQDDPAPPADLDPPGTAVWPPPRTAGPPAPDLPAAGPFPADPTAPGPPAPTPLAPGPLSPGSLAPNPPGGRVPLVGPAPIGLHLSAPPPVRPGAGHDPAEPGPPQEAEAEARPGRHSARKSLPARLGVLTGKLDVLAGKFGVRLRAVARAAKNRLSRTLGPARPPADAPATRVAAARARRRRRRAVLAGMAVTGLVAALTYAVRSPAPPPLTRETAPVAAPSDQAPVAPVPGDPVSPGEPLLDLKLEPLPESLSLTVLGKRDWRHWGGTGADSVQRKLRGTGEIQDPGGERLEHNAGVTDLRWVDGVPTAREEGTRAGVFQRGAGKSFTLAVTGSGDLRTVRLFVGTFSAGARLDVSLSGGGDPAVQEVALAAGDRFYQYVIRFRAPREERLLITWRALTVTGGHNDGVALQAITVS
ncbi:hypothetical protein [Micromonospora sp. B006]|uniref:hypothetical protein n=1 Tax=Micromonospora sp. B006 TaxID=2201999 RepID=UPI000E305BD0|nr:hypothetical protein [Micromonospora sp. B006]AXO33468.1 hypothetical protein MicB006_1166 [Micromonospora sp. B006]